MATTISPGDPGGTTWRSQRSQRTQAVPEHSLFGTALEQVDRESLQDIKGKYIPEGHIKIAPDRYPLPEHIKKSIPGREVLETSRREINLQRNALTDANAQLQNKAEKVFAFQSVKPVPRSARSNTTHPNLMSEKDLEHSEAINIVGLNEKGSYNRDKYGRKLKVHNYSLIGDLLAPNMDFNTPGFIEPVKRSNMSCQNSSSKDPGYHHIEKQESKAQASSSSIDLPPNIRHKFGSRICDNLLSDKDLVTLALERQKAKMGPPRPSKEVNVESLPVNMKDNYESLGYTTRYNVFPGISSDHTISQTQKEFNDEVHLRRVPNTDEFRYQRDELSTWSEHNVLRERMKKAWDEAYPLGGKKP